MQSLIPQRVTSIPIFGWFALIAALFSAFGQTFFIGLFGAEFQKALGLNAAGLGYLYGSATLLSGLLMFWLGELADRLLMSRAIAISLMILVMGAVLVSMAHEPLSLWMGFLLLRLGGQGLTGHLAIVAAARYALKNRGRSVAMASYGFIIAEASFPLFLAGLLNLLDWRQVWWVAATVLVLVAMPTLVAMARTFGGVDPLERSAGGPVDLHKSGRPLPKRQLTRWTLLIEPKFVLTLPMVLGSAFVITALFLHQGSLAEIKQWPLSVIATAFVLFAVSQAVVAFVTGRLIDAFGSVVLLRFFLWPMAGALCVLGFGDSANGIWWVFAGLGATAGANGVLAGAIWAELFGLKQLGLIRGVYAAFMVGSSAIAPMLFGQFLQLQWPLSWVAVMGVFFGVVLPQILVPFIKGLQAKNQRGALQ